jgi:hypothetical protein
MPKINGTSEVLADDADAVLGDAMTVEGPKRLRNRVTRTRRYFKAASPLSDDLGLADDGDGVFQRASTAIQSIEPQAENLAHAALPSIKSVVAGAVKGAVYGAVLGKGSSERRIGGGAAGGLVAFPVLQVLAEYVKNHLAEGHGRANSISDALLDDAAHVGGATASVVAAGGEAADGALAGTAVVVAAHVLGWFVRDFNV